jgi:hypothetical protein
MRAWSTMGLHFLPIIIALGRKVAFTFPPN